VYVGFIK